jgi:hypothetical protein
LTHPTASLGLANLKLLISNKKKTHILQPKKKCPKPPIPHTHNLKQPKNQPKSKPKSKQKQKNAPKKPHTYTNKHRTNFA